MRSGIIRKIMLKLQKAFTLIELLVVVAIIAMLAALLLPALGRAREQARTSTCMSNLKSIGTSMAIYNTANDGLFPTTYNYVDGEASSGAGYYHWTAAIDKDAYSYDPTLTVQKYPRAANQYVCSSHAPRGFAAEQLHQRSHPQPAAGAR